MTMREMYARQQTEKLGYDAAGNRIRRETEQEITTYRYDNCNRLQELRREYKNAEISTDIVGILSQKSKVRSWSKKDRHGEW